MNLKDHFVSDIPRRKFLSLSAKSGIAAMATPTLVSQLWSCKSLASEDVISREEVKESKSLRVEE